jgi:predicted metal-dependent RNase
LKSYVQRLTGNLKKIFCIHGEEESCLAHAETLRGLKPNAQVIVPEYLQAVEI